MRARPTTSTPARRGQRLAATIAVTVLLFAVLIEAAAKPVAPPPGAYDAKPDVVAAAAVAVDLTSGVELYAYNADQPLPPASTMKVVTALVAASVLSLDQRTVVAESEVLDGESYSVMGLLPGDELTVRDLLYGLLIPSGGDAALVLARMAGQALGETADPTRRFVDEMNAWSQAHGMTGSHFVNPTGDDADGQFVTARDLVRATALLLDDWFLAGIVATPEATVTVGGPNARELRLVNTNQLLSSPDVFGVKTGTDAQAGQCLIAGHWRGDNRIITVVLGSEDRYVATQAVLDAVDSQYRWLALGIGAISLGASDALAAEGLTFRVRRTVLMTQEQAASVVWDLVLEASPGLGGRRGYVRFLLGEREFARLPVYSSPAPG